MHELALIQEVVNNVVLQAKQNGVAEVTLIKLTVGRLSGVLSQALEFGFNAIKNDTELEGAQLIIDEIDPVLRCSSCGHTFTATELTFICKNCGGNNVSIIEGQELLLEYFEGNVKGEGD